MNTTTTNTTNSSDHEYVVGLGTARHLIGKRADMIDRLLYTDEAMNILSNSTIDRFIKLSEKRIELQSKACSLRAACQIISDEEKRVRG